MERLRYQFLAAAGLSLDQHRERRVGELRYLLAQLVDRRASPHQPAVGGRPKLSVADFQRAFEEIIPATVARRIAWFENPQILRYEPGGLYGPHADSDHFIPEEGIWKKVIDRDVSILLYLNQQFEGGELSFRQFNYLYRPQAGDLLFFPSHGQYAHQALPIKLGIRYVIVSWAAFREEPRVLDLRPSDCIELPV